MTKMHVACLQKLLAKIKKGLFKSVYACIRFALWGNCHALWFMPDLFEICMPPYACYIASQTQVMILLKNIRFKQMAGSN
jgi:hypothetical protein